MKTLYLIADGAQDPKAEGPTPFQRARTPNYDERKRNGERFEFCTVPEDMEVNSDVALLQILGLDPKRNYTGRAPLEAAGIGIPLTKRDLVLRLNFVYIKNDILHDFGVIFTEKEKKEIFSVLKQTLPPQWRLFPGKGYRNLLVLPNSLPLPVLPAPQDFSGKNIESCFQKNPLTEWALSASLALERSPVNILRKRKGLPQGNGVWLWGGGCLPDLPNFYEKTKKKGAVITAVDVVKGIAALSGIDIYEDASFTGDLHTNFAKKSEFALEALKTHDFVLLHIEAPDECSHRKDVKGKIAAIERIDESLGFLWRRAETGTEFFVSADHLTSVVTGKHVRGNVTVLKCVKP